jgi:rhodanese-related sulfurtransferase
MLKNVMIATWLLVTPYSAFASEEVVNEALVDYLDFAQYSDGVISVANVDLITEKQIIDTRRLEDFQKNHIPGAIHIEWRTILQNAEQLSADKKIILYCDTGILSSKAHLILRLSHYENVRVLFGGYQAWLKAGNTPVSE